jgi:hypothetical protein
VVNRRIQVDYARVRHHTPRRLQSDDSTGSRRNSDTASLVAADGHVYSTGPYEAAGAAAGTPSTVSLGPRIVYTAGNRRRR